MDIIPWKKCSLVSIPIMVSFPEYGILTSVVACILNLHLSRTCKIGVHVSGMYKVEFRYCVDIYIHCVY